MSDTHTPDRPLVTFALFAYNQEQYIREAIEGALAQTYEPLEIILSDDCSTDRTFEIMKKMAAEYEGPHQVVVRQNETNLGVAEHVNTLVRQSRGIYLVAAAGDDISLPHRTQTSVKCLMQSEDLMFAEMAFESIDQSGKTIHPRRAIFDVERSIELNLLVKRSVKGFTGASRTYRLQALRAFPPLRRLCPTEDSVFLLRCLLLGEGRYLPVPGIRRRSHPANLSSADSISKMNLSEIWIQYSEDVGHAFQKEMISERKRRYIDSWILKISFKRDLNSRCYREGKVPFNEMLKMAKDIHLQGFAIFPIYYIILKHLTKRAMRQHNG